MRTSWTFLPVLVVLVTIPAACASTTPVPGSTPGSSAAGTPEASAIGAAGVVSGTEAATPTSSLPTPDMAALAREVLGAGAKPGEAGTYVKDLKVGSGPTVRKCDLVVLDYKDGLPDGSVIADTSTWGYPFLFSYGAEPPQVIPGWVDAVSGMQAGGHRQVLIPPDRAYGPDGVPGLIPPNSPMLYDVELLEIKSPPPLPAKPADVEKYEQRAPGLEYAVLSEGTGQMVSGEEWGHIHYTGWLEDGTRFDTTLDGEPCGPYLVPLGAGKLMQGLDQGIAGMRVGEHRQLRLAPGMAFGATGDPKLKVPPNSTVIYDLWLMGTKPMKDPTPVVPASMRTPEAAGTPAATATAG
jgi:peptidylprolyl isomerase